ncbi:glycosyltransferase family 4 protein [Nocardiopsis coralliicola]
MKIAYLAHDIYGIGGTVRTVLNQAAALADRHTVEVVSVFRHRDEPALPADPRIRLVPLVDLRVPAPEETGTQERRLHEGEPRAGLPSAVMLSSERGGGRAYSLLTDDRLGAYLAGTDADVVVATRPGLIAALVALGPDRLLKVGQEHLTYDMHSPELRAALAEVCTGLDALTTVTEADAARYREEMALPGLRVLCIPNSVPAPRITAAGAESRTIVAGGRLVTVKRYDLLIDAFARVLPDFPDWRLLIYGKGKQRDALQRRIAARGAADSIRLMGTHERMEEAWALGAFAASASRWEPFGMTLVEAMRSGLPVVSTDCPSGPAEIIDHGRDGLLVSSGDAAALADGLRRLMSAPEELSRMGAAALVASRRYAPQVIGRRHEELFEKLGAPAAPSRSARPPAPNPAAGCDVAARTDGAVVLTPRGTAAPVLAGPRGARVPLDLDDSGGVLVDPADHRLVPGRWTLVGADTTATAPGNGGEPPAEHPCPAGLIDLRDQQSRDDGAGGVAAVLPHRGRSGELHLTVRRARGHAEVDRIAAEDGRLSLRGRVLGPVPGGGAGAQLVLTLRGSDVSAAVETAVACGITEDGAFAASVDGAAAAALHLPREQGRHHIWDVALRTRDGRDHPVGRLLDGPFGHAGTTVHGGAVYASGARRTRVRPAFTGADALVLHTENLGTGGPPALLGAVLTGAELTWGAVPGSSRPVLHLSAATRSKGIAELALFARLADATGRYVDVPLRTRREGPDSRESRIDGVLPMAGPGAPPVGAWTLVLCSSDATGTAEVTVPARVRVPPRRTWRGPLPVRAAAERRRGGDPVVTVDPVDVGAALRRRRRAAVGRLRRVLHRG